MSTSLQVAVRQNTAGITGTADVDESRSATSWSVEERAWKQLLPDLPDDVIALLATPVVVSAQALDTSRRSAPVAAALDRAPMFLAPQVPHVPQFLDPAGPTTSPAPVAQASPTGSASPESQVRAPGRHRR